MSRGYSSRHNAAKSTDRDGKDYFAKRQRGSDSNFVKTQDSVCPLAEKVQKKAALWKKQRPSLPKILKRRGVCIPLRTGSFGVQHNGIVLSWLLLGKVHENLQRERKICLLEMFRRSIIRRKRSSAGAPQTSCATLNFINFGKEPSLMLADSMITCIIIVHRLLRKN